METAYYSENELPYGRLSNHSRTPFKMDDGVRYETVTNFIYSNACNGDAYAFLKTYDAQETPRVFRNILDNEIRSTIRNACKIACEHKLYQTPDLLHDLRMTGNAQLTYPLDDILAPHIVECVTSIRKTVDERHDIIAEQRIFDAYLAEKILTQKILSGESNLIEFMDVPAYQIVDEHAPEMRDMYNVAEVMAMYRSRRPEMEMVRIEANGMDGTLSLLLRAKYADAFNTQRTKLLERAVFNTYIEKASKESGISKLQGVQSLFKLSPEMRTVLFQKAMDVYAKRPDAFDIQVPAEIRPDELEREKKMIQPREEEEPSNSSTKEIPPGLYGMGDLFYVDAMAYPSIAHYVIAKLFEQYVVFDHNIIAAHEMLFSPIEDRWKTVEELDAMRVIQDAIRERIIQLNQIGNEKKFESDELQNLLKSTASDRLFFVDYSDRVLGYDDCSGYENIQGNELMAIRKRIQKIGKRPPTSSMSKEMSDYMLTKAGDLVETAEHVAEYIQAKFGKKVECPLSGAAITSVLYYLFGCGRMMTLGPVDTLVYTSSSNPLLALPEKLGLAARTQLHKYMCALYTTAKDIPTGMLADAMKKTYEQTVRMRKNMDRILAHYGEQDKLDRIRDNVSVPFAILPVKPSVENSDLLNYGVHACVRILSFLRQVSAPFSEFYIVEDTDITCIANLLDTNISSRANEEVESDFIRLFALFSITITNDQARKMIGMILNTPDISAKLVFYSRITIYPIYMRKGRGRMVRVRDAVERVFEDSDDEEAVEEPEEEPMVEEREEDVELVEEEPMEQEEEDVVDDVPFGEEMEEREDESQ
jgi:predicted NAD-dependent protein-ADP-ribosyltransferase YbiA (DUF1768 family)